MPPMWAASYMMHSCHTLAQKTPVETSKLLPLCPDVVGEMLQDAPFHVGSVQSSSALWST